MTGYRVQELVQPYLEISQSADLALSKDLVSPHDSDVTSLLNDPIPAFASGDVTSTTDVEHLLDDGGADILSLGGGR